MSSALNALLVGMAGMEDPTLGEALAVSPEVLAVAPFANDLDHTEYGKKIVGGWDCFEQEAEDRGVGFFKIENLLASKDLTVDPEPLVRRHACQNGSFLEAFYLRLESADGDQIPCGLKILYSNRPDDDYRHVIYLAPYALQDL